MSSPEPGPVVAADRARWRAWLGEHGATAAEVWLVIPRAGSAGDTPAITHLEAVEEALCAGWIDSHTRRHGEHARIQRFSPRGPRSTWSAVNRELVERLEAEGRMTPAGREVVALAKRTGTWSVLAEAQAGIVPDELRDALAAEPGATDGFDALSRSARRTVLEWVARAKRPETRSRRIARTVEHAARGETPPELGLGPRTARPGA